MRGVDRGALLVEEGGHAFIAEQLKLALDTRTHDWPMESRFATMTRHLSALTAEIADVPHANPLLNTMPPAPLTQSGRTDRQPSAAQQRAATRYIVSGGNGGSGGGGGATDATSSSTSPDAQTLIAPMGSTYSALHGFATSSAPQALPPSMAGERSGMLAPFALTCPTISVQAPNSYATSSPFLPHLSAHSAIRYPAIVKQSTSMRDTSTAGLNATDVYNFAVSNICRRRRRQHTQAIACG